MCAAYGSRRADRPFVAINCAALPDQLLESELFGHERGAFTGAVAAKPGRIEQANGGVLFLDEVGEMAPAVQAKLLRVLEEREFMRVGGSAPIRVDVRVIAATNKELEAAVAAGEFRRDLYYRLNVLHVRIPPLRERREDIPLLFEHFLRLAAEKDGRPAPEVSRETLQLIVHHDWPGNVRELENVVERAVVLARERRVGLEELPEEVSRSGKRAPRDAIVELVGTPLAEIEQRLLDEALRITGGNKTQAAKLLGIDVRTVARKLDRREEAEESGPEASSA